ncbi:trigger factor [Hoylesella buccalis]|uniref:Peptidylprolyl isomerase n=1 Tax=Hoylesella buccalis DNF00853 TaxID=1401074 RepID=A0A095ZE11_9BACT|nr:trigger factor [Hoylesella buccalis]KGF32878.1 peptidylprolyl isomerase [Hoylesella buccalis DNF00853]
MNISFENPDKINGQLTVTVEESDYKEDVEKTLKDYRKKANMPGFRPGQVPMGMIKRQYGPAVKMDVINKQVGSKVYDYIKENNIPMLGEPLASEKHDAVDLEKDAPYTFVFDIAVAPEFKIELNGKNKIDYYKIQVDDKLIDQQVDSFAARMGEYVKAETFEGNDMLKGDLRELDEQGSTKEGGLTVEAAVLMPAYIKVEEEKKKFDGAKLGDIITFNPRKAYASDVELASFLKVDKEQVKDHEGNFSYQITEISRFQNHAVNQELFDNIYGKDAVKDEKQFREKIAEGLKAQLEGESDYKFLQDVRAYAEKKVGKLEYPDELLKRIMRKNNPDKDEEFVEKNYDESLKQLTWHLIKEQLVKAHDIKVEDKDVKEVARAAARAQFAQYGMSNVPDEYIDNYVNDLLKKQESVDAFIDRAVDTKLTQALKNSVKLNEKEISLDDFQKMMEAK